MEDCEYCVTLGSRLDEAALSLIVKAQRGEQMLSGSIFSKGLVQFVFVFGRARRCAWLALSYLSLQIFDLTLEFGNVRTLSFTTSLLITADARKLIGLFNLQKVIRRKLVKVIKVLLLPTFGFPLLDDIRWNR